MNPNTEYPQGDLFSDVIKNLGNPDVNGDSIVDLLDYYDIRDHYPDFRHFMWITFQNRRF